MSSEYCIISFYGTSEALIKVLDTKNKIINAQTNSTYNIFGKNIVIYHLILATSRVNAAYFILDIKIFLFAPSNYRFINIYLPNS